MNVYKEFLRSSVVDLRRSRVLRQGEIYRESENRSECVHVYAYTCMQNTRSSRNLKQRATGVPFAQAIVIVRGAAASEDYCSEKYR